MFTINTDGGSRGNPGPSAWAFIVKEDNQIIHKEKGYIGISTNNQAEYTAVFKAFQWLLQYKKDQKRKVNFILDSELVARQLTGIYRIKDQKLKSIVQEIKKIQQQLEIESHFSSVPRSQNRQADLLVNEVLDEMSMMENSFEIR